VKQAVFAAAVCRGTVQQGAAAVKELQGDCWDAAGLERAGDRDVALIALRDAVLWAIVQNEDL